MATLARVLVVVMTTAGAATAAPTPVPVFTVPGGEVLDADATRILYVDGTGTLRVQDRGSGVDTVIGPITSAHLGRLTSTGAYVATVEPIASCGSGQALLRWSGSGALVELDRACTAVASRWTFGGDWAARLDPPLDVTVADLATGAQHTVQFPSVTDGLGTHGALVTVAMSDTGDLYAAWTPGTGSATITLYRDRGATRDMVAAGIGNVFALTARGDGYAYSVCGPTSSNCRFTRCQGLNTGCTTASQLATAVQLAGGWTYADEDASILAHNRIARVTAADVIDEVGSEGDLLETGSPDGALTLLRGADRYLVRADASADRLSPAIGRAVFLPDALYLIINSRLYRVDDGASAIDAGVDAPADPDAGTGPGDAGAADASTARASDDGCSAGGAPAPGAALIAALALARARRRRTARAAA